MKIFKRLLGFTSALMLTVSLAFPQVACATETTVTITNQGTSAANKIKVSSLLVDGLDAPVKGKALDSSATVNTKEGYSWEIPAIWLDDKGGMFSGTAKRTDYRPVLVFYIPEEYEAVTADGKIDVQISDAVKALIGMDSLRIIASNNVGINFILDETTFTSFAMAVEASRSTQIEAPATASSGSSSGDSGSSSNGNSADEEKSLVDMFCANTAKDAIDEESLYNLVYKIIYDLIPQAVQILEEQFPAFGDAAKNGELGKQIGLYVYYKTGDKDGIKEHGLADDNALAFVADNIWHESDGDYYGYFIGVNTSTLLLKDENDEYVLTDTGKYLLKERDTDLENTILHEMVHALMDDYNRVGSTGCVSPEERYDETPEGSAKFNATYFPTWFFEGMAGSVANGYRATNSYLKLLRYDYTIDENKTDSEGYNLEYGFYADKYSEDLLLQDYIHQFFSLQDSDGEYYTSENWLDLEYSGKEDDATKGRDIGATYGSGYLAILYLGEMAAKHYGNCSSIVTDSNGQCSYMDSGTIKYGVNEILTDLHYGKTFDAIINEISGGTYANTDDFEKKFIKGTLEKKTNPETGKTYDEWTGDPDSLNFCTTYLNYMLSAENNAGCTPNGSIIQEFDDTVESMMTPETYPEVEEYAVAASNKYTYSSVDRWEDGGKSRSGSISGEQPVEVVGSEEYVDRNQVAASVNMASVAEKAAETSEIQEARDTTLQEETTEIEETIPAESIAEPEKTTEPAESTAEEEIAENTAETTVENTTAEENTANTENGETEEQDDEG